MYNLKEEVLVASVEANYNKTSKLNMDAPEHTPFNVGLKKRVSQKSNVNQFLFPDQPEEDLQEATKIDTVAPS
jgi:hypothetical protein